MRIVNGLVFDSENRLESRALCFDGEYITSSPSEDVFDAEGCYVLPGFIDIHNHGCFGTEFSSADEDFTPCLDKLSALGITAVVATTRTLLPDELFAAARNIGRQTDKRVLGIHMEGPFVNPARMGAMNKNKISLPNIDIISKVNEYSGGKLKNVSMAVEMENGFETAEYCLQNGISVSFAHTDADYDTAKKGFDMGINRVTHLYNGMRPFTHRDPGVLGCALTDGRVCCELICDLYHVSAAAIDVAVRCKGVENIAMISDSGVFSGLGDGVYVVDNRTRYVENGLCLADDRKTIAGSTKTLYDGVKNMFSLGYTPWEIGMMASNVPARLCGDKTRGDLKEGMRADIVVLDKNFDVAAVFVGGERIK